MKRDQLGLTATSIKVVVILFFSLALMGLLVVSLLSKKSNNNANGTSTVVGPDGTTQSSTVTTDYKGWKQYKSGNGLGLAFKYPASWVVEEAGADASCTGQIITRITASASDAKAAFAALKAPYQTYSNNAGAESGSVFRLNILRGGASNTCATAASTSDGTSSFMGFYEKHLNSLDNLSAGAFKGNYVTLYGPVDSRDKTMPDFMVVTSNKYNSTKPSSFTDTGVLSHNGANFQITPELYTHTTQYTTIGIDATALRGTAAYKQTLNILNSLQ